MRLKKGTVVKLLGLPFELLADVNAHGDEASYKLLLSQIETSGAPKPVAYVVTPKDPRGGEPFLVFAPTVLTADDFREDFLLEPLFGKAPSNAGGKP